MKLEIKMLDAYNGDCFLISIYDKNEQAINILVDGGISKTYIRELSEEIKIIRENKQNIDFIFVTHVDNDHIGGIISLFEDEELDKSIIKRVIYNSALCLSKYFNVKYDKSREIDINKTSKTEMSYEQGNTLEEELLKYNLLNFEPVKALDVIPIEKARLTILSPQIKDLDRLNKKWERENSDKTEASSSCNDYDKTIKELLKEDKYAKDKSIPNRSSISFLLECGEYKLLMLADSRSDIIVKSLEALGYCEDNKLKVEYVKLPHHGSKNNLNYDLLKIIECNKFIISTDGSIFNHPDKVTLARIINVVGKPKFYFNSDIYKKIFLDEDYENYEFDCIKKRIMEMPNGRNI